MGKVPSRRYPTDDFVVMVGGEVYRPHEGEWVEMRGGPSWDFMRDAASVTRLEKTPFNQMNPQDSQLMTDMLDRLLAFLASRLVAWNWTGADGEPLPPPTKDVLGMIDRDEVLWLIQVLVAGNPPARAEESEKNV